MTSIPALVETKYYERAVLNWDGPRISIISATEQAIAHIPLAFVAQGGNNTWDYVLEVIKLLVVEIDGWIFANDQPVNAQAMPIAGTFVYKTSEGSGSLHFAPGPSYTTPYKPADVDGSISTRNSYASTPNSQTSFRNMIHVRDVYCLISGTFLTTCEAAHIVPKSRPDVYRAILGLRENEPVGEMYHASAGLLLDPALHKAFDRLDFSFYYRNGILYAHFFRLDLQNALLWHGMAIPHTRFNIRSAQYWPKPEYLQWHYRQCLMARMRGFSA